MTTRTSGYGNIYGGARKTTARTKTSWSTKNKNTTSPSKCATGYSTAHQMFQQKMNSYKTLWSQTYGPAKCPRPSPTTLNTFANWINKGANVYTVTTAQLNKWAGTARNDYDWGKATSCKKFLDHKFGKTTIKAVTKSKSGSYMVVCAPTWKGKTFQFPH